MMLSRRAVLLALFAGLGGLASADTFYTPERDKYAAGSARNKADNDLPKVLLIGDSVMGGYFKQVKQLLEDRSHPYFRHHD